MTKVLELPTPHGLARAHVQEIADPAGLVALGHGAGGGVGAPDLRAAAGAATRAGFTAALVEQPYRVAGRRTPAAAAQLDAAWTATVDGLRRSGLLTGRLVVGGRSAGARVACRTATDTKAAAVLCLAFPLHPPGRADEPSKSRLPELDALELPVLVVQGENDPFGRPPVGQNRRVVVVAGTHALRDAPQIERVVGDWLAGLG